MDNVPRVPPRPSRREGDPHVATRSSQAPVTIFAASSGSNSNNNSSGGGGSGLSTPPPAPASAHSSSTERLLRNIEETSDLLRTFRLLKERGASRDELSALHARVRGLKASQARQTAAAALSSDKPVTSTPRLGAPSVPIRTLAATHPIVPVQRDSNTPSTAAFAAPPSASHHHPHHHRTHHTDPNSSDVRLPSRPDKAHGRLYAAPSPQGVQAPHAAASPTLAASTRVPAVAAVAAAAAAAPLHSIVFAIVLAESHTRRELLHKWERRLLRYWADFKEERVAIALRPVAQPPLRWLGDVGVRHTATTATATSNHHHDDSAVHRPLALQERTAVTAPSTQQQEQEEEGTTTTAARYLKIPPVVPPQLSNEAARATPSIPVAAVASNATGEAEVKVHHHHPHEPALPLPVPAAPPSQAQALPVPLPAVAPTLPTPTTTKVPTTATTTTTTSPPSAPPGPSIVPLPSSAQSADDAVKRNAAAAAAAAAVERVQADLIAAQREAIEAAAGIAAAEAAARRTVLQAAAAATARVQAVAERRRREEMERAKAMQLRAQQEAAEAEAEAARIKAEEDAAEALRSAEDEEADDRRAVEDAEGDARRQLKQDADDAHARAADAEAARLKAEEEQAATRATEAARLQAQQEAADRGARVHLDSEQHAARSAVEDEESGARVQLLRHAANNRKAAGIAAERRAAHEDALLAAAAKAAEEVRVQREGALLISSLEHLTNSLQDEWISDAAAQAVSRAAARERRAKEEEERRKAEEQEEREKAAHRKAEEDEATAEAARAAVEKDAVDDRRAVEDAEGDARRQLKQDADDAYARTADAKAARLEAEAEENAAEAARVERAKDAATHEEKRQRVDAAENVSAALLDGWLRDAATTAAEAGARTVLVAKEQVEAERITRDSLEAEEVAARAEVTGRERRELGECCKTTAVQAAPRGDGSAASSSKHAADAQRNVEEASSAAHTPTSSSAASSTSSVASSPSSSSSSALRKRLSAPDVFVQFADDFLAGIIHQAAEGLEQRPQRKDGEACVAGDVHAAPAALVTREDRQASSGAKHLDAVQPQSERDNATDSASARTSPSSVSLASNASTSESVPPRAEQPSPLAPPALVTAAAAAAAAAAEAALGAVERTDSSVTSQHKARRGETEVELKEAAHAQASADIVITSPPPQSEPRASSSLTSNDADVPAADAAHSSSGEATPSEATETTSRSPHAATPTSAAPHGQQHQQQQLLLQREALQAVPAGGTCFSSPMRSLSMNSSAAGDADGDGDGEEEEASAAMPAQGVQRPLNLTPPSARVLSPLITAADDAPETAAAAAAAAAGVDKEGEAEKNALLPSSIQGDGARQSLQVSADAPHGEHCDRTAAAAPLLPLHAAPRQGSGSGGGAAEADMGSSAIAEDWKTLDLDASTITTTAPAFTVEALEAASAHMTTMLIHDAVRLLPTKDNHYPYALLTSSPKEGGGGLSGEWHYAPSLSPERLDRVRPLSPSHALTLSPDGNDHVERGVTGQVGSSGSNSSSNNSSSTSSGGTSNAAASTGDDGERHADKKHATTSSSINDLGPGFTRSDAQEGLPLSPRAASSLTPLVGAPTVAPGVASGEGRSDLASLTTLVTAVATPNDFVEQLRQQEEAKKENAYQQNRYLSTRELALIAAEYLTSEVAAGQLAALGPPAVLTARAIALVLSVGLVHRVTVANRHARRRVEAAKAAAASRAEKSGAATTSAHTAGACVGRPSDTLNGEFPASEDVNAESESDDEDEVAPSSPSLGRRGFGGVAGEFAFAGKGKAGGFAKGDGADEDGGGECGFPTGGAGGTTVGKENPKGSEASNCSKQLPPSVMSSSAPLRFSTGAAAKASAGSGRTSPPPPAPTNSPIITALAPEGSATKAPPDATAPRKLPLDWIAGLRGVAERIARDFMDYASRCLLLSQGEGQSCQDHLRTANAVLRDALARVNINALLTQELRARDVARLTVYYLDLAMNGAEDRADPLYAPAALGEHNMFGRRSSGDVEEGGGSAGNSFPGGGDRSVSFKSGDSAGNSMAALSSLFASSPFAPPLHPRNETLLTAATAIHVRRGGLSQLVFEHCVSNVMSDLIGDTVGWLGTALLQPSAPSADASRRSS
ncbi:kinetoplast-associated protein-like protein [Leptomonas pyrrhocoris]|uniref:Kinetoplast-associated protein-like protein n=1 Tax=Leptomonas pyrrhocoris TaxID=157538 RepID=A0A0M9G2F3_LEPPY|nr:kinetoplast-associated protein-like protein [Leptomonas pyrrhocoris]KPA80827.1 kinetoplast-associated protein-like protein [Leptomonas pyrrhocoris]|eukprot:XP_015659266.1 kinetoplast-associated protein-like protein [Leptomonas pyrrhocoris]